MLTYLRILLNARLARMDERGASVVEYALIVAAVAVVLVPVTLLLFLAVKTTFRQSCAKSAATGTC